MRLWWNKSSRVTTRRARSGIPAPRPALRPAWVLTALQLLDCVARTGIEVEEADCPLATHTADVEAELEVEEAEELVEGDCVFDKLTDASGAIVYP